MREGASNPEIVFNEFAVNEVTFNELAARKTSASESAVFELHLNEDRHVEKAPVPHAVLNCAANENRVDLTTFCLDVRKITVSKDVIGPTSWLFKAEIELFRLEKHVCANVSS
jgi:hypothetical protein